jgi:hypothetical protein
MRRLRKPAEELRRAIDCLPVGTREAMLDGIDHSRIIVGAYVDRQGGVCPMLAAHRNGGRTSLVSFAHAWDRYTNAGRGPRPATDRELRTLRTMLGASLGLESPNKDAKARPPRRDTGERDRTEELRDRPGWAWLRLFRRYDHYERAVREAERRERECQSTGEREPERV